MIQSNDRKSLHNRWTIVAATGCLMAVFGAVWLACSPLPHRTVVMPNGHGSSLRVEHPADWTLSKDRMRLDHRDNSDFNTLVNRFIGRRPGDNERAEISFRFRARQGDIQAFAARMQTGTIPSLDTWSSFMRPAVHIRAERSSCQLGEVVAVSYEQPGIDTLLVCHDYYIFPSETTIRTMIQVSCSSYPRYETGTLRTARDILSRLRWTAARDEPAGDNTTHTAVSQGH